MIMLHIGAIYAGCSIAQLEYVDIWRSALIAGSSYIVMLVIAIPLGMILVVLPVLHVLIGAAILLLGTMVAAKVVLSLDWKDAWIIAATAGVVNFLAGWMFSSCETQPLSGNIRLRTSDSGLIQAKRLGHVFRRQAAAAGTGGR